MDPIKDPDDGPEPESVPTPEAPPAADAPQPEGPVTPRADAYEVEHDTLQGLVTIITTNTSANVSVGECIRVIGLAQRSKPIERKE